MSTIRYMTDLNPRWVVTVGRNGLPVSVADAKKQLEIAADDTTHDNHLEDLIEAATDTFEKDTDFICIETQFKLLLTNFPSCNYLPTFLRPVTSVSAIQYRDGDASLATFNPTIYRVAANEDAIILNYGETWPQIADQMEAVEISFTAGNATAPEFAKQAIEMQVANWFEDRDMMMQQPAMNQYAVAYQRLIRRFMRSSYP